MLVNNTKDFYAYMYAYRLFKHKAKYLDDFKLRRSIYGEDWAKKIWKLYKRIERGEI